MNCDDLVAPALASQSRRPLALEAKGLAGLGADGDGQFTLPVHRGHLQIRTQSCLGKGDGNHAVQVVTIPLKIGVVADMKDDIEIPCRPSTRAPLTFACETQPRPTAHTGWNPYAEAALPAHSPLAGAGLSRDRATGCFAALSMTGA